MLTDAERLYAGEALKRGTSTHKGTEGFPPNPLLIEG